MSLRMAVLEPTAHLGGAQISLLELVHALDGDPRVVIILPEDGPLRDRAARAGADVRVLEWPRALMRAGERASGLWSTLRRAALAAACLPLLAARLNRLLRSIDADVLVTNGIKAHIVGAVANLFAKRRLVWYLRDLLEGRKLSTRVLRVLAPRCAATVAISHCVAREASRELGISAPTAVIYNIVDLDRFNTRAAGPPDVRKAENEIWFGVVGALTPLKGQDVFLQAAAIVAQRVPRARFVLVGSNFYATEQEGGYEKKLRGLARAQPLEDRVLFLGQRDDMPAVFRLIDVLVQPNRGPEALGRSILEAMASGVPVIAVDRWGPAELVSDGMNGMTTPWMDAAALADRMIRLAEDTPLRLRLGHAGREWVSQAISPRSAADRFRDLLQRMR